MNPHPIHRMLYKEIFRKQKVIAFRVYKKKVDMKKSVDSLEGNFLESMPKR